MSSRFHRKVSLKPFAPPQNGIVHALDVHLQELTQETLSLRYTLHAEVTRLRIPATTRKPQHTDELWKHTCFEMFVRKAPGATAYYELNFSPSTEWALYAFEGYHKNPVSIDPARPPQIRVKRERHRLQLDIRADLSGLPHAGDMALAAVIEDENGTLSYWALKHAAPEPDFHHPDSFLPQP
ncbi:DOMON-like domain-containing protein [Streptomyces tubercidicus]|uniref:DOMON-like domain-containing protein n=1 Tax=Streptomyces tubercidicus TaxID=47759 RepID=UPI002E0FD1C1|nr:DOMON-like domain-containing protein [Streptomyces tubercidicus]